MLDIKLIRDNPDLVRKKLAARHKGDEIKVEQVREFDQHYRKLLQEMETLSAQLNAATKEIGALKSKGQDASAKMQETKAWSTRIGEIKQQIAAVEQKQKELMLTIPNLTHDSVPVGKDSSENPVVKTWGEKPKFDFTPKPHWEVGEKLGMLDFARATKITGSGFILYKDFGARLERALINFMLDLHTSRHAYTEILPPFIVNEASLVGTGQLPKFEDQLFKLTDERNYFLTPTAEVPVINVHRDEIFKEDQLPISYCAYTPCFRSEAGAAGTGTRGMIRVHQFDKVELIKFTTPEQSQGEHEKMLSHAEAILQELGLHYRIVVLCTGDIGFGMAKTYDIEVWAPGQNAYLEVSSVSNAEDFQARRAAIRYKAADGKNKLVHTLNGSGVALARLYVALLETYQSQEGKLNLPAVLDKYLK